MSERQQKDYADNLSDFRVRSWWNICLRVVTPFVLQRIKGVDSHSREVK